MQEEWIADWEQERVKCRFCGQHRADCADPEHAWYPQRRCDYAAAARAVAKRMYEKKHEAAPWHDGTFSLWANSYSRLTPFHRDDGVEIWVSREDLTPEDDFI